MKKFRMDIIFIILLYLNLLVVFKVISSAYIISNFNYGYITLLFLIGAGIFLLYRHVLYKASYRIAFTIAAICVLALIAFKHINSIYAYFNILQSEYKEISIDVFNSTDISFVRFKEIFQITVPAIAFIFLCIMACGFSSIIIFAVTAFMITFWYINFRNSVKEAFFVYVFSSSVTYAASSYFKNLSFIKRKGIRNSLKPSEIIGFSCLICVVMAVLIGGLPKLPAGKHSSEIRKKIEDKFNGQEGGGTGSNRNAYGIVLSGYNDSSNKLGGPIEIDDTLAFRVKADKPFYLKGATKDYYDGFSWTRSDNKLMKMDASELPPNQALYTSTLGDPLKKLSIYPEKLQVSTAFTPEYLFNFGSINQNIYYDREHTYTVKKDIKTAYDVYYYEPKGDIGILTNSTDGKAYKAMDAEYSYCSHDNAGDLMPKYSRYLEVPATVPPEVYSLVGQITNGCTTEGQKVQKICEYLKKNYTYTLAVSVVPDGKEFVDYFLFREKQGYCTYFATAAAVMCRIAGVPSRYAEGFRMTNNSDGKGYYLVTNKEAHAWAEVLIGPGTDVWSIIDCTPAQDLSNYRSTDTRSGTGNSDMNTMGKDKNKNRTKDISDDAGNNDNSQSKMMPAWVKVCALISLLFLLYFIFTISAEYIRKNHIARSKSVIPLYSFYIKKMKSIGYVIPKSLSDKECAYKIDDPELKKRVMSIIEYAYSEHFGNKTVSDMDKNEYLKYIADYIKQKKNKNKNK
jgi:hypothetical protein